MQHFVWPGINFSWQAQYFRQVEWKNRKTHWYEAASSALNFPFLKEVSQNSCVFDVVKFRNLRSLAELLRFGCCPVHKMKKCRRIASFLILSTSKNEKVTQNCCVFDVVKFEKWGSHAELLHFLMLWSLKNEEVTQNCCVFWCCQLWKMKKSRRIVRFSRLQIDR